MEKKQSIIVFEKKNTETTKFEKTRRERLFFIYSFI